MGATGRVKVSARHVAVWAILDEWVMTELIALATIPRPGTKTTSRKAGLLLAKMAAEYLAENRPLPDQLRIYLATALQATAGETDANRAWNVCMSRNQTDPADKMAQDMEISIAYKRALKAMGSNAAFAQIAEQFDISERAVREIIANLPEQIRVLFR